MLFSGVMVPRVTLRIDDGAAALSRGRGRVARGMICGRAFTLVESLVVILIAGVVLAIALPVLLGARTSAQMAVSASNLRQIGVIFDLYETSERAYPVPTLDEFGDTRFYPHPCDGISIAVPRWQAIRSWPALVHDYASWTELGGVLRSPSSDRDPAACGWPTSYMYSSSFLARPEAWVAGTAASDALLGSVSRVQAQYPSGKVLLWDNELPFLSRGIPRIGLDIAREVPMIFIDGHTDFLVPAEAVAPEANALAPGVVDGARLHNTPNGVRGFDYP